MEQKDLDKGSKKQRACSLMACGCSFLYLEATLLLMLGIAALLAPFIFTLAVDMALGFILAIGSAVQIYRTLKMWENRGSWASLFGAIATLIVGGILIFRPFAAIFALTFIIGVYFCVEGILKLIWTFSSSLENKKLLLLSSVVSLLLAFLILSGLPGTAIWVIGMFVGIDLLFASVSLFGLARQLKI